MITYVPILYFTGFPVLLNKSQLPSVKIAKTKALEELQKLFEDTTGNIQTTAQISKKVSNLKQFVKSKADMNLTGNKKIRLQKWETEFLDLLGADTNPVFSRVQGKSLLNFITQSYL